VVAQLRIVDEQLILQERRNDYDVTNSVKVSSPHHVARAVRKIFQRQYPAHSFDPLWLAFLDFDRLYGGRDPEYHAVDTAYHDIQHSLDMTLALARLIAGYELTHDPIDRLGPERARCILVTALYHDAGYIRHRVRDRGVENGAEFTRTHVSRSAAYLEQYLPRIGLGEHAGTAARVVHYTGYEIPIENIELDDPKDRVAGELLGTADLVAQMADRCYLEKCRDRLYPEFVLGRIAVNPGAAGSKSLYQSGRDLLSKTMTFYQTSARKRLDETFHAAYRYFEHFFGDGSNPYMLFIDRNLSFLETIERRGDWSLLRRRPPCVMPDPNGEARLMLLALKRLRSISYAERETTRRLRALALDPNEMPGD
jgi:hypothetical protein